MPAAAAAVVDRVKEMEGAPAFRPFGRYRIERESCQKFVAVRLPPAQVSRYPLYGST